MFYTDGISARLHSKPYKLENNRRIRSKLPSANTRINTQREYWLFFTGYTGGAYHLTEESGWGVKSIMVSDWPVYCRTATSVTVWIQKRGRGENLSSVSLEPRRNREFGKWYTKFRLVCTNRNERTTSIFGCNFRKVTLPFTFHPEFLKFSVKW